MNHRLLLTGAVICAFFACHPGKSSPDTDNTPPPSLDAQVAISHMQVEDSLQVQLVAAEPLVVAPVAMTFDTSGRAWVVEMTSYMPDTLGTGEADMNGRIVILSDSNHDGRMDTRKIFLDSLVLPRAVCLVGNGVLVAEPPKLWFVENDHDHPGKRTLVDSAYAYGGNVGGKGAYLANMSVTPADLTVAWGYTFNAQASVPSVLNVGTTAEPIGAAQLQISWKVDTVMKHEQSSNTYFVRGDGVFTDLSNGT